MFGIARDIVHNEDISVLQAWTRSVLCATGMFKLRPTTTARYGCALQTCEHIATLNATVCRNTLQRIHEVNWSMKRLNVTTSATNNTAAAIAYAYTKSLKMWRRQW
ncbi:MAG: hypothetical protein ACKPKO_48760, partial [Candidatus Fonsibacter sp.]